MIVLMFLLLAVVAFQWDMLGEFVLQMTNPFVSSITRNGLTLSLFFASVLAVMLLLYFLRIRFKDHLQELPFYDKIRELIFGFTLME